MNDLKLIRALGAGEDDYLEDDVAVRARARLQSHIAASRLPDRDRARPRVDEQRRTNRVRALVSLAVSALILAGALLVASADPLPSGSYTILPATAVAAQALDSVRSQVNSEICTQGALDTIGTLASTTFESWSELEPANADAAGRAATAGIGSDGALLPPSAVIASPDTAVFALFLTGDCADETGSSITQARAVFVSTGLIVNIESWPSNVAPATDPPFGQAFDATSTQGIRDS